MPANDVSIQDGAPPTAGGNGELLIVKALHEGACAGVEGERGVES